LRATRESTDPLRGLFEHAGGLKEVRRSGWAERLGLEGAESVADHSYATAFIAMVYSDIMGLDTERVVRMALLHDLAESVTGDVTPGSLPEGQKESDERAAMDSILGLLPERARGAYRDAWAEYLAGETREASLVRQADKLEMAMQARRYAHAGDIGPFMRTARERVSDPDLVRMLEACGDARGGAPAG